jgi:Dyp-type peroxidase family
MRRRHPLVRIEEIQRVVLLGNGHPAARFLFLAVEDAAGGRRLLGELAEKVTTGRQWREKLGSTLTVAVSWPGLVALEVPAATLAGFPAPFREGMQGRLPAQSHPASAPADPVHLLLWVTGEPGIAEARTAELTARAEALGVHQVCCEPGELLPGDARREHFGYADGLSQPSVEGVPDAWDDPRRRLPHGRYARTRHVRSRYSRTVRTGEFVLGYPDEEGVLPPQPEPAVLARNGSYLVFRKLQQDVAGFRALLRSHGEHAADQEWLAAKMMGRWRDGTPLALSATRPHPARVAELAGRNDFGYADDPDGYGCPLGAHIRRTNPRDGLPLSAPTINRHRMIRRGIPYGKQLPAAAVSDDGLDRGLLFVCFVADIARQFEFVQRQWVEDGNALGAGAGPDPVIAGGRGPFMIPGSPPTLVPTVADLVRPLWGEYFFAPGIRGLHWLSRPR